MDPEHLDVARELLYRGPVLRTLWLVCVLAMAPAIAQGQPGPASPALVARAQSTVAAAEQKLGQLTTQRAQLSARYQQQLQAIDRLKKQKASWRRDRELNTAQADANDTAKKLTALDRQLAGARQALLAARRSVVIAIDAELASGGVTGPRAEQLARLRAKLAPPAPAPKKIVIPDAEIDPLADPQELEQQAAALAAVEQQLEQQRKSLDSQHEDLKLVAELRQAHDRAGELSTREDDQPQRGAPRGGGGSRTTADEAAAPQAGNDSAGGGGTSSGESFGDKSGSPTFETSAAVALGEVIDRSTIDGLVRASRSGDPRQRAEAARLARDAVAKRLDLLKKKRAMIEARAKQLRGR